jgi:hypothetical protein
MNQSIDIDGTGSVTFKVGESVILGGMKLDCLAIHDLSDERGDRIKQIENKRMHRARRGKRESPRERVARQKATREEEKLRVAREQISLFEEETTE